MQLILALSSVSGIVFVIRTIQVFRERGLIDDNKLMAMGLVSLCVQISSSFWIAGPWQMVVIGLAVTSTLALCVWLEKVVLSSLAERLPTFLDRWILEMKLGQSVVSSRDRALREEAGPFQLLLRPLLDSTSSNQTPHLFLSAKLVRELQTICASTHSALPRLESLRSYLRQSSEFRRKSGQAVRQTSIQASVMLLLLVALAGFAVRRHGWAQCGDLIVIATTLSLGGIVLMRKLARKTKWKI